MPRHPYAPALFGLWLISLVALTTLLEFWRGTRARMRAQGESAPAAVGRLLSRNRRRYGGYIIHLGVVMIALGVVGDAYFKSETQYLCKNNFRFSIEESKKRVE